VAELGGFAALDLDPIPEHVILSRRIFAPVATQP
jgi:hypothetical protein